MHVWDSIKNFLYDKENFIATFDNKIYIYGIEKVQNITKDKLTLYLKDKKIKIVGSNLKILKCDKSEILLNGDFKGIWYE